MLSLRFSSTERRLQLYRLCSETIGIDRSFNAIEAFRFGRIRKKLITQPPDALEPPAANRQGYYWIAGRQRALAARINCRFLELAIEGIGGFTCCPEQGWTQASRVQSDRSDRELLEIALGPLLIPLLAPKSIFLLHASSIATPQGVVAFVGDSGAGKSTLAAFLASPRTPLVSDDQLPVARSTSNDHHIDVLPDFPQLKLPPHRQPGLTLTHRLPLRAVVVLGETRYPEDIKFYPLDSKQTVMTLIRHSVATRLFDKNLLAAHLRFCTAAGTCIRGYTLSYPRNFDALPKVRERLESEFWSSGKTGCSSDVGQIGEA